MGKVKRTLSILLAVAMVVTCIPQAGLTAKAAELDAAGAVENAAVEDTSLTNTDNDVINEDIDVEEEVVEEDQDAVDAEKTETPVADEESVDSESVKAPMDDPEPLTVELAEAFQTDITYDGAEHKPGDMDITVKSGETPLTKDTDYTVKYLREGSTDEASDFISVGEIIVAVAGVGETYGSLSGSAKYTIVAADISGYKLTGVEKSYEAGDNLKAPTVEVKKDDSSAALTVETDYTVAFTKGDDTVTDFTSLAAGDKVTVTVTGKGNYTGTITTTFDITAAKIKLTAAMVTLKGEGVKENDGKYTVDWKDDGDAEPEVVVIVKDGDKPLVKGSDYEVVYSGNKEAGEEGAAKVTVTGKGNYTGEVEISFTVVDVRVELKGGNDGNCTVTVTPEKVTYTGEEQKPEVTVTYKYKDSEGADKTKPLVKDTDYTVAYEDNKAAGNAKVIIKGKGDYKGEVTVENAFVIEKAAKLTADPVIIYADVTDDKIGSYDLSAIEFKADGKVVTESATYAIAQKESADDVDLGDVLDAVPTVADGKLTYVLKEINDPATVTKDATVVLAATFDNYAESQVTVTIKAVKKDVLVFKADDIVKVYTSEAIDYNGDITQLVGGEGEDKDNPVADDDSLVDGLKSYFTYSYNTEDKAAPVNANTAGQFYEVTISLSNHETYKAAPFKAKLTINPAKLTITAIDKKWIVNSTKPSTTATADDYEVSGLLGKDTLTTPPTTLTYCQIDESGEAGAPVGDNDSDWKFEVGSQLLIVVAETADAGSNYTIEYKTGTLTVAPDKSTPINTYEVRLHNVDHRGKPASINVPAGELIDQTVVGAKIEKDAEKKYEFKNWYKDEACTKLWDFATETVQSDMDLYAVWATVVKEDATEGLILQIRDIPAQTYTGSKIQPNVQVYDAEGRELKKGKDYTIAYDKNINADAPGDGDPNGGYRGREGQEGDSHFNADLPHVIITGKGNYAGTKAAPNVIKKNFHIEKASIGNGDLAAGFTMKYTDQFVVGTKDLKPFTSLKYKKAMTLGTDYDVKITAVDAYRKDADGKVEKLDSYEKSNDGKTAPVIEKGCYGQFTMIVSGKNVNYTGEVRIPVTVAADSSKLLKNAKINLGKNIKSVNFSSEYFNEVEEAIILPVANVADGKCYKVNGSTVATEASDVKDVFTVSIGKSKNLTYLDATKDYEISYANNDAVGKATLTITAIEGSGYVGSVSTTFTIKGIAFKNGNKGAVEVTGLMSSYDYTGRPITPVTTEDGIKVVTKAKKQASGSEDENAEEEPLKTFVLGQDYTVKYANNLKMGKKATITFTANPKSGYTGSFKETFQIGALSLVDQDLVVLRNLSTQNDAVVSDREVAEDKKSAAITWTTAAEYAVAGSELRYSLVDKNGNPLKLGTDFTAKYSNNKAVTTATTNKKPTLTITGKGNYSGKLVITFAIVNGNKRSIQYEAAATQLNAKKAATHAYTPKITVKNGTKAVNKKEYEVEYANNKQANVKDYLAALESGDTTDVPVPTATIKIKRTSSFYTEKPVADPDENGPSTQEEGDDAQAAWDAEHNTITIPLTFYKEKLTTKNCTINLTANPGAYRYTGDPDNGVKPTVVSVVFNGKKLTMGNGQDVTVEYGANNAAGKNKGTVTVTGHGIYGGSVTKKFNIDTSYIYKPNPESVEKTALTADNTKVTLMLDGKELARDEGKYWAYATGSAVEPEVKVEFNTDTAAKKPKYITLLAGDSYNVTYGANNTVGTDAGTVTITADPSSELYSGNFVVKFDIKENRDLSKCDVILYQPGTTECTDTAKLAEHEDPDVADYVITVASIPEDGGVEPAVVVKNGEKNLEGTVYTVTYADNDVASAAAEDETPAKVATVTIMPAEGSEFFGTKVVKFWINVETPENPPASSKTDIEK